MAFNLELGASLQSGKIAVAWNIDDWNGIELGPLLLDLEVLRLFLEVGEGGPIIRRITRHRCYNPSAFILLDRGHWQGIDLLIFGQGGFQFKPDELLPLHC